MDDPHTRPHRGRFITLEGGEGAGKSTQCARLAEALRAMGQEVITTREPGGSKGAEEIRALLVRGAADRWDGETETLLHYAARRDHLRRTIDPALQAGVWVISDRFNDSTLAYQGYGHGLDLGALHQVARFAIGPVRPDLTVVLDVPVEAGLARTQGRLAEEGRYESMALAFHHRVRHGFLTLAAEEPERCAVIDATQPVDQVHAALLALVRQRLPLPQS